MIEIVPFEPRHLGDIDPPVGTKDEISQLCEMYQKRGPAYSAIEDGRVVGCSGINIEGDCGMAWAFLSDSLRKRPAFLPRAITRGLARETRAHNLKKVMVSARADWPSARRWLERLGFTQQGINGDYVVYGYERS